MTRKTAEHFQPRPEIVAVFGQRAGVGATSTAVDLSLGLAAAGRSVLLVDLDPAGRAGQALGYASHERGGTERALLEVSVGRDMITATKILQLYLAPAGPGLGEVEQALSAIEDSQTRLYQALASLDALSLDFEHVVLDCPPTLDLLTRNALMAAHRVILPLSGEQSVLYGLPTLLKTISQLRAGFHRPLYGVYLLIGAFVRAQPGAHPWGEGGPAAERGNVPPLSALHLIDQLRQDYGRMTLLTEIPFDERLRLPQHVNQPLLMQVPSDAVGQAYLSLAAEWLTLSEPGDQRDGTWSLEARQERMEFHRATMIKGIERWRIDPLSRLYDPDAASRHQDAEVLEELFEAAQPTRSFSFDWRPGWAKRLTLALLALVVVAPLLLWAFDWMLGEDGRVALATRLIGRDHYWEVGSLLLARADETAYRELVLGARLVDENRERLLACAAQVSATTPAECRILVPAAGERP